MAANSQAIKLDVNGKPAPQYFNPDADAYEYLLGKAGANRVLLYDAAGNPLLLKTPTGETQSALGVAGYGHDGTAWRPLKANTSGQLETDVIDRAARLLGKVSADDGAFVTLGALADAAKTDPTQAASVIALLKGLMQTLRTDSAKVQLTGRTTTESLVLNATVTAGATIVSATMNAQNYTRLRYHRLTSVAPVSWSVSIRHVLGDGSNYYSVQLENANTERVFAAVPVELRSRRFVLVATNNYTADRDIKLWIELVH